MTVIDSGQQVLEGLGWRIHRIWSTDWFRNSDQELRKTAEAIEAAKTHIASPHVPTSENSIPYSNEGGEEPESEVETTVDPTPKLNSRSEKYKVAEPIISTHGRDLYTVPLYTMAKWVQRVVEIESPVHIDEVTRRITNAVGISRIGNRIRNTVGIAAHQAARSKSIQIQGKFLYWVEQDQVPVRDRSGLPNASRKLELIAPEELQIAIKQVVSDALGIERDDLTREACKLFGFKTASGNMRQRIELILNEMIERGDLIERDGSLLPD